MKRSRIRPVSRKRQRRDAVYAERRQQAYDRADGRCEAMCSPRCNGQGEQTHHIGGRGGPDPHRLENLVVCCRYCHEHIHDWPADSYAAGLMVSRHGGAA